MAHPRGKSPANGRLPTPLHTPLPKSTTQTLIAKTRGAVGSRIIKIFSQWPHSRTSPIIQNRGGRRSGPLVSAQVVLSYPINGRYSGPLAGAQVVPSPPLLHTGKCSGPLASAQVVTPPPLPLQLQNLLGLSGVRESGYRFVLHEAQWLGRAQLRRGAYY